MVGTGLTLIFAYSLNHSIASYFPFLCRWAKFGNCRDFALIGKDTIAMASGIYVRFHDPASKKARVERFDGGERGDGACCLAGLSVSSRPL